MQNQRYAYIHAIDPEYGIIYRYPVADTVHVFMAYKRALLKFKLKGRGTDFIDGRELILSLEPGFHGIAFYRLQTYRTAIAPLLEYGILDLKYNMTAGGGYGDDEIYFLTDLGKAIMGSGSDKKISSALRFELQKPSPKIQNNREWVNIPRWNRP